MNALEPVMRKSNCITGMIFLELIFLKKFIPPKTLLYLNKRLPLGLRHKEVEEPIRAEGNRSQEPVGSSLAQCCL